jgi:hypothetical protein
MFQAGIRKWDYIGPELRILQAVNTDSVLGYSPVIRKYVE